jgi:hypothetical protein
VTGILPFYFKLDMDVIGRRGLNHRPPPNKEISIMKAYEVSTLLL